MSQTTSVDSLFSRQEKGKFLNEEELKQIQQDLSYLIDENKTLSKKIEYYQKTISTGQSIVPNQVHDQTIVHEKKIMEQEKNALEQYKNALEQEKYAIEQNHLALEKHQRLLEQQLHGVEQEKQVIEKQKQELEQRSGELEKQRESYSNMHLSTHGEHVMSIDVQLIYFMLFIILLILILKK